ncbi:MAG: hypothetical protein ACRYG8_53750 [Janthinobacterium lividum]
MACLNCFSELAREDPAVGDRQTRPRRTAERKGQHVVLEAAVVDAPRDEPRTAGSSSERRRRLRWPLHDQVTLLPDDPRVSGRRMGSGPILPCLLRLYLLPARRRPALGLLLGGLRGPKLRRAQVVLWQAELAHAYKPSRLAGLSEIRPATAGRVPGRGVGGGHRGGTG